MSHNGVAVNVLRMYVLLGCRQPWGMVSGHTLTSDKLGMLWLGVMHKNKHDVNTQQMRHLSTWRYRHK